MGMTSNLVENILLGMNEEVLGGLSLAGSVDHPGEGGRARENVLVRFFSRLIPASFSISSGFVIDGTGAKSRQIDLVIYRNHYHPVFEVSGIKYFAVESVAVVMENKTSVASTKALRTALENIKSVKALDRTNGGRNYLLLGHERRDPLDPCKFNHQVFGAVLTERSLEKSTLRDEMLEFLKSNDRRHWPNCYADVRGVYLAYQGANGAITDHPAEAQKLLLTDPGSQDYQPPLLHLAHALVDFLRVVPVVDFQPSAYFPAPSVRVDTFELPG